MILKKLFSPISIGKLKIKNRAVMAPMATDYADGEGEVSQKLIDYIQARAKGGVGLITLEICSVDEMSPYVPRTVGLYNDRLIPGLKKLTDAVHEFGAKIIPQIAHPGPESLAPIFNGTEAVGPSAGIINNISKQKCREISREEIKLVVKSFGESALRAKQAGFDGLEFHVAHGYMLAGSFLSAVRNRRIDEYGGNLDRRMRFPLEIIESIKKYAGDDFPIVLRISGEEFVPGGRTLRETIYMVSVFEKAGVHAFHVSGGVYPDQSWRVIPPTGTPFALNSYQSSEIKKNTALPVMLVGRIIDPRLAEDILQRNDADMAVFGRALIADSDIIGKAEQGRFDDIASCFGCGVGCVTAREKGGDMTCVINPLAGREGEIRISPVKKKKKIYIAGAGPGGLEAARVASQRGHDVTVFEKETHPGGQMNLACAAPSKQEVTSVVIYLYEQAVKSGAKINFNSELTVDIIIKDNPDAVIVATGAKAFVPDISGCECGNVYSAHDVLAGKADIQPGNVLIIGGGLVGCETAEFLATTGDDITIGKTSVTVVEKLSEIGADMFVEKRILAMKHLRELGVKFVCDAEVKEIFSDGISYLHNSEEKSMNGFDNIIFAVGAVPVNNLVSEIGDKIPEVIVIGDAKEARQALEAIAEGNEAGRMV